MNMKKEIDNLRDFKLKTEKNKKGYKDTKELEERIAILLGKVEELTKDKAKVEAELVRMTKVCDMQQESLDRTRVGDKDTKKEDVKCMKFENEGCEYGEHCRFIHPSSLCKFFSKVGRCPVKECKEAHMKSRVGKVEQKECEFYSKVGRCPVKECKDKHISSRGAAGEQRTDCYFWLNGGCKYDESDCKKGRHIQEKLGANRKKESFLGLRQEPGTPGFMNIVDYMRYHQQPPLLGQRTSGAMGRLPRGVEECPPSAGAGGVVRNLGELQHHQLGMAQQGLWGVHGAKESQAGRVGQPQLFGMGGQQQQMNPIQMSNMSGQQLQSDMSGMGGSNQETSMRIGNKKEMPGNVSMMDWGQASNLGNQGSKHPNYGMGHQGQGNQQ